MRKGREKGMKERRKGKKKDMLGKEGRNGISRERGREREEGKHV